MPHAVGGADPALNGAPARAVPGVAIELAVLGLNQPADGLRDRLDPRPAWQREPPSQAGCCAARCVGALAAAGLATSRRHQIM